MVFCFGLCLAPYAVFSTGIYLQHIAWTVESDRPLNIVFVRLSIHPFLPRIEIKFEFDMVFCFGIHLALYAVFQLKFTFNTLHDLLKVIIP